MARTLPSVSRSLSLMLAVGAAVGLGSSVALAQPHARRGEDGLSLNYAFPVVIRSSIDLRGEDGADGRSGAYFLGYTAEIGGGGGNGGTLTLQQGGLIELASTQSIRLTGGKGGIGGVSWNIFTPNYPDYLDDGPDGLGGDLICGAPTTITLRNTSFIESGLKRTGTLSGAAVMINLFDQSALRSFGTIALSGSSVATLSGASRIDLDWGDLNLTNGASMSISDTALLHVAGLNATDSFIQQAAGRIEGGYQTNFSGTQFIQRGGTFECSELSLINGCDVQILAGNFSADTISSSIQAVNVTDSSLVFGQGSVGPNIHIQTTWPYYPIRLIRSTLTYNAGTWNVVGPTAIDTGSEIRIHAANFNAGYVNGSFDWLAGTIRITDSGFSLGDTSTLGTLLGGNTVVVGTGKRLAADQAITIRPAALTLTEGGKFAAAAVVGIGSAPLGFSQSYIAGTFAGSSLRFVNETITATRQASSIDPPFLSISGLNLAQGTLSLVPVEQSTSTRASLIMSGDASNGIIRVASSPRASISFQDFGGTATLRADGTAATTVARVNNATFGGVTGAGGVALEGPLTINAPGNTAFSGSITGAGSFTKTGTGTFELNGGANNTFTGTTRVAGGTLLLKRVPGTVAIPDDVSVASGGTLLFAPDASNQIADAADVTIEPGGTMNMSGQTEVVRSLLVQGSVNIDANSGAAGMLSTLQSMTVTGGTLTGNISNSPLTINGGTARVRGSASSVLLGAIGGTLQLGGFTGNNQFVITGPFSLTSNLATLKFTTASPTNQPFIRAVGTLSYPLVGAAIVRVDQFNAYPVGTVIRLIDFGTGTSVPQLSKYALAAPSAGSGRGVLTLTGRTLNYVVAANPCAPDYDASGTVDVPDIFEFLSTWFGNSAGGDFDRSGAIDVADIFAFLSAWFQGCA